MILSFPSQRPDQDAPFVWHVQQLLLQCAESLLGSRDSRYTVWQPRFLETVGQPHIRSTLAGDGAVAYVSTAAADYWPTLVYELAHETVHLLNPVAGSTNLLEEGIAVAFSIQQSASLTSDPQRPGPSDTKYITALTLTDSLPGGSMSAGQAIRARFGALGKVTQADLASLFPSVPASILTALVS